MKRLLLVAALIIWILCGYIDYGYTLGYFDHRFPWTDNSGYALLMALGGPFALPASLSNPPLHWRTKPPTVEERWKAFHEQWPSLGRSDFEGEYN